MYKLTDTTEVDINREVAAVAAFLATTWTPIQGLPEIIERIKDHAFEKARAWIDGHPIWQRLSAMEDARTARLEAAALGDEEKTYAPVYDGPVSLLQGMALCSRDLREAGVNLDGRWDYEKVVNALSRGLRQDHPQLGGARPLGWEALAKDYCDFDGMAEFDQQAAAAGFDGADATTVGAGNLVSRTALPYVMYDEMCQGRKAYTVLVGAIFAHFLTIAEHRNTQELLAAIEALPLDELPAQVVFDTGMLVSANPLLQALIAMAQQNYRPDTRTPETYADALAKAREFNALPEAEQQAQRAKNRAAIEALLSSVTQIDRDAEEAKAQRRLAILRERMPLD